MAIRSSILLALFVFLGIGTSGQINIQHLATKQLDLIYPGENLNYLVPHAARCFENSLSFHNHFWDYTVSEPVSVLFNDFSDIGNGGANVIPRNFISIGVGPFDYTLDVLPANERMQWLMSHELTHVVMCDKGARSDALYRKIFRGKIMPEQENPTTLIYSYLTTPRWYSPRWFHEGIATFMETWMSGGMGRVLGGYDEMVFRSMVRDSAYFYRPVGLESEGTAIDFQVGANAYLYGTRFFSYLANSRGVDKLKDFCARSDSSRRFFAAQFKQVYQCKLSCAWEEWIAWEKQHQEKNMALIREFPLTNFTPITPEPLGSVSRYAIDKKGGKLYAAVNYPGKMAHLCSVDLKTGETRKIASVSGPSLYLVTHLAYDDSSKTLFISDKNQHFRGLVAVDVNTGKKTELMRYTRAGDFAFNQADRALYATQAISGRVSIIRIPPPYKEWTQLLLLPFGYSLFNLDISPDGQQLAATLSTVDGTQKLILYQLKDLMQGMNQADTLYEFEDNNAANFLFSADGKSLYGTSYYTGVSNVFRIDINKKEAQLLSNTLSGFFRPVEYTKDSLVVLEFREEGLQPGFIPVKQIEDANAIEYLGQQVFQNNPVVEQWMLPPPSSVNIDSLTIYHGRYRSLKQLRFSSAIPILEGYKDHIAYGYRIRLQDNIFFNSLKLNITYSPAFTNDSLPEKQKTHVGFDYSFRNFNLFASYNYADFYDLFGKDKLSRAGYSVVASYNKEIQHLSPFKYGFGASVATYGMLEKLPEFQNVSATYDALQTITISYKMSRLRKSLGAIDNEQGYDWRIYGQGYYVGEHFFPKVYTRFDAGFLLPWRNASLWFKAAAGQGFAERTNPFSNFYFGGFGYNYIDTRSGSRQSAREMWGFAGLDIDEAGGKNFARLKTECFLPPLRFRKLGFLWFYVTYARLSIFGSGLGTNLDEKSSFQDAYNSGTQLDVELVLFSLMKSTLSFGWARAYRLSGTPSNEFMVSLRLM